MPEELTPDSFMAPINAERPPQSELTPDAFMAAQRQPKEQATRGAPPALPIPHPQVVDQVATAHARAIAPLITGIPPAPPMPPNVPGIPGGIPPPAHLQMARVEPVSRWQPVVDPAMQAVFGHAIESMGGTTATQLYDNAMGSLTDLVSRSIRPEHLPPGTRTIAPFVNQLLRAAPEVVDFLYTPAGAAAAMGLGSAPAWLKAAIAAAFATDMGRGAARDVVLAYQNPTPENIGRATKSVAMTVLPVLHGTVETVKAIREKGRPATEKPAAEQPAYTMTGQPANQAAYEEQARATRRTQPAVPKQEAQTQVAVPVPRPAGGPEPGGAGGVARPAAEQPRTPAAPAETAKVTGRVPAEPELERRAAAIDPSRMDPNTRAEYSRFWSLLKTEGDNLGFDRTSDALRAVLMHRDWASRWDIKDPELIRLGNKFGGWAEALPAPEPKAIEAPVIPIQESPEAKAQRETTDRSQIVRINAREFQRRYEQEHGEPLAWSPERSAALKDQESFDAYPQVVRNPNGRIDVEDGRHRIAEAARRGASIDVAVEPGTRLPAEVTLEPSTPAGPKIEAAPARRAAPPEQAITPGRLPAVPEGMIRIWRGEMTPGTQNAPVPDWVRESPKFQETKQASGRWWTEDPAIAQWYVNDAGENGRLVYQDVPRGVVEASRVANNPDAARYSADPEKELFLPAEYAGKGKPLEEPATPPPGSQGEPPQAEKIAPATERSRLGTLSENLEQQAQAAMERLRKRGTFTGQKLNTGIDPEDLSDLAIWGAAKLAKGAVDFTQWSGEMLSDLGEQVRPHLEKIYRAARGYAAAPTEMGERGPVFRQFRHDETGATFALKKQQDGEAIAALRLPPEFARKYGDVDLVWGYRGESAPEWTRGYGLAHILAKHPWVEGRLQEMLGRMTYEKPEGPDRRLLWNDAGEQAVISLSWFNRDRKTWLLTEFDSKPPATGGTLDGSDNPRAGGPTSPPSGGPEEPSTGGSPLVPGSPQIPPQGGGHPPPGGPGSLPPGRSIDVSGNPVARAEETTPSPSSGAPASSVAPESSGVNRTAEQPEPPPAPKQSTASDLTFGAGLGALEPFFREAKAEGDALRAKRNAALAAAKLAEGTPQEKQAGEALRSYYTSERDLWAARAFQAIEKIKRNLLPKIQDREALGIMREFRHRPGELAAFIDGSHPYLQQADGGAGVAMNRLQKLLPVMRNALRMLSNPTRVESDVDQVFTNMAQQSLDEGRKGEWLESRWKPDEYLPHLINPKGEGELAKLPGPVRRRQGRIGKEFSFSERRQDEYPTMVHAIADGLIPKTLDPAAAFAIHQDNFARARATHLFEAQLAEHKMGVWGDGKHVPDGWVRFAPHTDEWVKQFAYPETVPGATLTPQQVAQRKIEAMKSGIPYEETSKLIAQEMGEQTILKVGHLGLWVPPFIEKAMAPVTSPEIRSTSFAWLRTRQRELKEAILGLSGFHLLTENMMAAADIGPRGMLASFRSDRNSPDFLLNERDFIRSGGTTSIQGAPQEAYRAMEPGTIPQMSDVVKAYMGYNLGPRQAADAITRLTFDNIQRRFKVISFQLHRDSWMRDNPLATPEQIDAAKQGIASYVNGVYGGLHWENMAWSRMAVDVARFLLLAPDWSGSNIALGKYVFDSKFDPRAEIRIGDGRLRGATTKESAQARLSRAFWTKQLVGGLIATQMLSLMLSGKPSKRPFQVSLGQDNAGREVYENVFFRGSAGDAISFATKIEDHGLLGSGIFAASKMAPLVKAGEHVLTGRDDLGREISPENLNWVARTVRGVASLATDVSPIPITLRNLVRTIRNGGDWTDNMLWSERMLGLFGPPGQHVVPQGFKMGPEGLEEVEPPEREPAGTLQQIWTGRPYQRAQP